jgi:hypothetical protein
MSEYLPLLVFPSFILAERDLGTGGGGRLSFPGKEKQVARLGPKFITLQKTFEAERIAAQQDPQGLAPEFVLVIETRGRIEDFCKSAISIGMNWLGEIDLEDLEPDDDFHKTDLKTGQASEKKLDGRLYMAMTNQRALEELLRLWELYKKNKPLGHGNKKWGELFDYAKDIRRWGVKDRLSYSGILDEWAEDIANDPDAKSFFRLEMWYRDSEASYVAEDRLRRQIEQSGGRITAACRMESIRFHAVKGYIPIAIAKAALSILNDEDELELPVLFRENYIKYFLPIGQGIATQSQEVEPFDQFSPPPNDKPPIVALLDGYPLSNHDQLSGRLIIYDPGDLLSRYDSREMRHGTAMASLIVHGELDAKGPSLSRKIYCHPILEPDRRWADDIAIREHIPESAFAEDRIHRAVVEMLGGESPSAPTVKIINLSIGERPFDRELRV